MSSTKRHTYRPGDAIDPGATYYPMDGARQRDPLEPDDVIAALDAMAQEIENLRAELDGRAPVSPADHWSPWLEWRGGPCPLPDRVQIAVEFRGGHTSVSEGAASHVRWRHSGERGDIIRFRYRVDNPAGWLPRGDWIPPAELWDEGCPVRCEWTCGLPSEGAVSHLSDDYWDRPPRVQYIRLIARQPQAGLPEVWWISEHGDLMSPSGRTIFVRENCTQYTPGAIRQAVDAWLRERGDE